MRVAGAWAGALILGLGGSSVAQGVAIALGTLVLEDAVTIGSGLLVADGRLGLWTAFVGLSLGIAGGDLGLYLMGRLARRRVTRWKVLEGARVAGVSAWFERNVASTVLASRFLPGMRVPTYVGAGLLRVSAWRFLAAVVVASFLWTSMLFGLTVGAGHAALAKVGQWKAPLAFGLVALAVLASRRLARGRKQGADGSVPPDGPVRSRFELWPPAVFYLPIAFYCLWLAVRFRGLTLPTAANPSIYSGGMIRESKSQILSLVPASQREWVAPWVVHQRPGADVPLDVVSAGALAAMVARGLSFPIVAKPDEGQRGDGVRPVRDEESLREYLSEFPPGCTLILQQLVEHPNEVGILYHRHPGEETGHVFSITSKEFPEVVGDGQRTLRELVLAGPRTRLFRKVFFRRHAAALERVLADGERFPLVFSGNHCQGAVFRNGAHLATPALEARIDAIARSMPGFFFGRFDVRYRSAEELARGEGLQIVEVNGAAAEATHIWDPRTTLAEAYRTLFRQFRILFEIGALNRDAGHRPLPLIQVLRDARAYSRLAVRYPATM